MPSELGTATVVDHRIPIAFWMLVVCAVDIRVERAWLASGFMLLFAAVFLSRVAVIQTQWAKDNILYNQAERDMASLPGTSRVAAAYPTTGLNKATRPAVALYYMPALEYVPKGGFTQILWTIPDQHPLVMQPHYQQLAAATPSDVLWQVFVTKQDVTQALASRIEAAIKEYDYVVFLDVEPFQVSPTPLLEPVQERSGIKIYQVRHDEGQKE